MLNDHFHLYIDSGNLADLRICLPHPAIYGVTTNPTLLKRANVRWADLPTMLKSALDLGATMVQAQVGSMDAAGMLSDARALLSHFNSGQLAIKIPATLEGFRAGGILASEGVPITYTAVYSIEQAHFAVQLGAHYAAPYLGRLLDAGEDGMGLIARMQKRVEGSATRLLVASIRSKQAFVGLLELGVGSVTVPPALFVELFAHPATARAEQAFFADAAELRGEGLSSQAAIAAN
jgi:transaldolase